MTLNRDVPKPGFFAEAEASSEACLPKPKLY